jgi:hypothetical protein
VDLYYLPRNLNALRRHYKKSVNARIREARKVARQADQLGRLTGLASEAISLYAERVLGLPTLTKDLVGAAQVTQAEEGRSYQTAPGVYGLDVVANDTSLECDESAMSVVIPYADGRRRDGVGDLLEVGGIVTERHQLNPICCFDHGTIVKLPIGVAEDPKSGQYLNVIDAGAQRAWVKCFLFQGKKRLTPDSALDFEHAKFCEQLFHLASQKMIRGGSIGYQVLDADHLGPDYGTGVPRGLHLKKVLMLEASLVVLPANMDTVGKFLTGGTCCGKSLSRYLVKSLSRYAPPRRAQLGYEGKGQAMRPDERNYRSVQAGPQSSFGPFGGGPTHHHAPGERCTCGGKCETCKTMSAVNETEGGALVAPARLKSLRNKYRKRKGR